MGILRLLLLLLGIFSIAMVVVAIVDLDRDVKSKLQKKLLVCEGVILLAISLLLVWYNFFVATSSTVNNNSFVDKIYKINTNSLGISLSYLDFVNSSTQQISKSLAVYSNLHYITANNLNYSYVTNMAMLINYLPQLKYLRVYRADSHSLLKLLANIKGHQGLKGVLVRQTKLDDKDLAAILQLISVNSSIVKLGLDESQLSLLHKQALLGFFNLNYRLIEFSMRNNKLDDMVLAELWPLWAGNVNLRSLDLSGNNITDASAVGIEGLLSLGKIIDLQLAYNKLTGNFIQTLAKTLARNTSLQVLNLQGNPIDEAGALLLYKVLGNNHNIKVNLTMHDFSAETQKLLYPWLKR